MIQIPYERVREAIKEQKGFSESDIDKRVQEKLTALSGLISKDGAIHIIANELGVKLMPDRKYLKVKDLLPGMRGITMNLRVLRKYELREFSKEGRSGKVASFLAGDETGVTRVTLWNEQAEKLGLIEEGMIIQIRDVQVKENQGRVEVHLQTGSEMITEPKGVVVEANAAPQERSFTTKKINELSQSDEFVDILGTILQVYDPRSFTKKTGGAGIVANVTIDDGSGTIRASFWDDDCRKLFGEAIAKPELMEAAKLELLGQIVKVQGRCRLNAAYNTLELSVSRFVLNPDPTVEMNRLS